MHELYKTGDQGAPDQIKDRNGEVVLDLCKKCGRAEIELSEPCDATVAKMYRSKVVSVRAARWDGGDVCAANLVEWTGGAFATVEGRASVITLEGELWAPVGHWIIQGAKGEFYPCDPEVFAAKYESCEEVAERQAANVGTGLDFGVALEYLKQYAKVRRAEHINGTYWQMNRKTGKITCYEANGRFIHEVDALDDFDILATDWEIVG